MELPILDFLAHSVSVRQVGSLHRLLALQLQHMGPNLAVDIEHILDPYGVWGHEAREGLPNRPSGPLGPWPLGQMSLESHEGAWGPIGHHRAP